MLGRLIGFTNVLIVRAVRDRSEFDLDGFSFSLFLLISRLLPPFAAICESACHCGSNEAAFFLPLVSLNLGRLWLVAGEAEEIDLLLLFSEPDLAGVLFGELDSELEVEWIVDRALVGFTSAAPAEVLKTDAFVAVLALVDVKNEYLKADALPADLLPLVLLNEDNLLINWLLSLSSLSVDLAFDFRTSFDFLFDAAALFASGPPTLFESLGRPMSTDLLTKHRSLPSALPSAALPLLELENNEVFRLAGESTDSAVALDDESKLLAPISVPSRFACFCSLALVAVLNVLFKLISFFGSMVDFSAIIPLPGPRAHAAGQVRCAAGSLDWRTWPFCNSVILGFRKLFGWVSKLGFSCALISSDWL